MNDTEDLREKLLSDVYGGAISGLGAIQQDEDRIREAAGEGLEKIASQYGYK